MVFGKCVVFGNSTDRIFRTRYLKDRPKLVKLVSALLPLFQFREDKIYLYTGNLDNLCFFY